MRSVLRQKILKPKDVAIYSGGVNEVITDLIKRIYTLRSQEEDGETVTNVNNLFFKYSMEGKFWLSNTHEEELMQSKVVAFSYFCHKLLLPYCD